MENIFFSFSFSEFKPLVEHIVERVNESVTLQRCGLHPHHLAQLEAFKHAPLENSLQHVRDSRYMVCLLGKNVGSEAKDGKTYIDFEIEAALDSDVEILAFLIGERHRLPENMSDGIQRIYRKLSDFTTIGTIGSDDYEEIARTIIRAIERDVWRALGEDDQYAISNSLLDVSGFPRKHLEKLPIELTRQLNRIYHQPAPEKNVSPIAADVAQRKYWAYESLKFGHTDEAIKNLQKAHDEFGSDFFSCFWLGRLYAFSGTRDKLKKVERITDKAIKMLDDSDDPLLISLCYTHLAVAAMGSDDFQLARTSFDRALEKFQTYDTLEFQADMYLIQLQKTNDFKWAVEVKQCLATLQRLKLSHYLLVCNRLEEKHGTYFNRINESLNKKIGRFYHRMYSSGLENQQWIKKNFPYAFFKMVDPDEGATLLQRAYIASKIVWQNYRMLRAASSYIFSSYEAIQQEMTIVLESRKMLLADVRETISVFKQAQALMDRREQLRIEEKEKKDAHTQTLQNLKIGNYFTCFVSILFAVTLLIKAIHPSNLAIFVLFMLVLLIVFLFIRVKLKTFSETAKNTHIACSLLRQELDDALSSLWDDANSILKSNPVKDQIAKLRYKYSSIHKKNVEDAEIETVRYIVAQMADLTESENLCNVRYRYLSTLTRSWFDRVDTFEQYSVSAHNGQYNHLLYRKGKVMVARKSELDSENMGFSNNNQLLENIKGRALHVDGSRLKAWFDDSATAEIMLSDLHAFDRERKDAVNASGVKHAG